MLSITLSISFGGNLLVDRPLHVAAQCRGFFNSGGCRRAQVQLDLPGVDAGKEILAQPGQQRERTDAERQEDQRERSRGAQGTFAGFPGNHS